ncbi:hypothetical protein CSA08_01820 [Candidatus Gracilibacteria bacterium]|nr:MAG: hypothetical protein CSA08_01820 [Candidatus Gracilibacteria bacterium]
MQYKIPVQIENDDPIMFGLSLKQLIIIVVSFGLGFGIFKSLVKQTGTEVAFIPAFIVFALGLLIALFKHSEMTFIKFILAFIRLKLNRKQGRVWMKGVDSFQPIDIGYVLLKNEKVEKNIDFKVKIDKINELNNKIDKI